METLKKYFPFAFTDKKDTAALVITILLHIGAGAVIGVVSGIIGIIPIIGRIVGLIGSLINLYITASLILSILDYCKVFK